VILVGNKSDLVRKRSISRDGILQESIKNIEKKTKIQINYLFRYSKSSFEIRKFLETSVAIYDKVDALLAGILIQIRLHEANSICENNTEASSIDESNNKHCRNYSDTQVDDLSKMNSKFKKRSTNKNFMSFKNNTITNRLFRKNK